MTDDQSRLISRASAVGSIDRPAARTCIHCGLQIRFYQETWVHHRTGDRGCFSTVAEPEGVTLTPEEARRAVGWLDMSNVVPEDDDLALASRLEASS